MLRNLGAASVTTFDTRAALEGLEANRPDLGVVDPCHNGVSADVDERLVLDRVPFIVYSGADVDEATFGQGGWLDKPITPETLRATLERLLV